MAHTTSRLGLDVVDGGDAVSNYPAANVQAMGVLDNAVTFTEGTLVSRPAASIAGRYYLATDDTSSGSSIGTLYFDTGAAWVSGFNPPSRGATNIATSQSTSSTTYTTLATPDQVTGIVLPTNGLLVVWCHASWQESVVNAARAAIFVGANQLQASTGGTVGVQETFLNGTVSTTRILATCGVGLFSSVPGSGYTGDLTTGQSVGMWTFAANGTMTVGANSSSSQVETAGPCYIFAAAGTYTVGVQFKASSGSVTASNRKLWVRAIPFS